MTHLSSCYFCGAALDKPLQTCELPTPEADGTTTMTLCSSCLEKVNVVLDATGDGSLLVHSEGHQTPDVEHEDSPGVSEHEGQEPTPTSEVEGAPSETEESDAVAETDESSGDEDTERGGTDASVGETPSPDERQTDPDSTDESPSDVEAGTAETDGSDTTTDTVVSDDPLSEEDDPFSADAFDDDVDIDIEEDVDEDDVLSEGDALATETGEDDVETAEFGEGITEATTKDEEGGESMTRSAEEHSEESDGTQPEAAGQDNDDATGGLSSEEGVAESDADETEGGERTPERRASQGGADDAKDKSSGDSGDEETAAKTTISALEYNKVMRMLQNRDFPVNRDEIELVAANAYDLARSECAQVIDLAVDRGLLDEREGQLHRPEE